MPCGCDTVKILKLLARGGGSFILLAVANKTVKLINVMEKEELIVVKHCDPFLSFYGCKEFEKEFRILKDLNEKLIIPKISDNFPLLYCGMICCLLISEEEMKDIGNDENQLTIDVGEGRILLENREILEQIVEFSPDYDSIGDLILTLCGNTL